MDQLAAFLFCSLILLVVGQLGLTVGFLWAIGRYRGRPLPDEECPRAAVILCLRGSDPFLSWCIQAILDQDYPAFELRIVVDHGSDPALPIVEQMVTRRGAEHAVVQLLADPDGTCSLKCSSLIQAVETCDDSIAFVAQLDADAIPHRTWLRELAAALYGEQVGAATGNRWYMPDQASWGALVRYAWNAAAVVQMYWYGIAWGGTLAIKTSVIRDVGLLDRWRRAFCEDTMLYSLLREKGLRIAFVPSLIMINRETCDVRGFCRWVQRQLLTARLYHPRWPAVAAHGLGTTAAQLAAIVLIPIAWIAPHERAAWLLAGGLAIYQASMILMLVPLERSIRRIAGARSEPARWLSARDWIKLAAAIPLTQAVYAWSLAVAMRLKTVDWRGVSYEIAGPWEVRLIEYRPFDQPVDGTTVSARSL